MSFRFAFTFASLLLTLSLTGSTAKAQVAIRAKQLHTMASDMITDGVVLIEKGKIKAVGPAAEIVIPDGYELHETAVATPGLIDGHTVIGLGGILNQDGDQDQLESSKPVQPALRAIDAYNSKDQLIEWVRGFGVTTLHTGHGPGELISGQTMVIKTNGNTVEDAVLVKNRAIAATLGTSAQKSGSSSPGTRAKMMEMLREEFLKASEYRQKTENAKSDDEKPPRDLDLEALVAVLKREVPLMVTADRVQDIANALRLAKEFDIELWLDSGAESYLLVDEIKEANIPVIIHPTMARATGEKENLSFETAAILKEAGITVVMQSGFEGYVPKTRVVLYEAGWAAANGLTFPQALASVTIDAAKLLGIEKRVGSIEVGKDADIALYDGDPFEYTTHCTKVFIEGVLVSDIPH